MSLRTSGFAGTAKLHDLTAGGVECDLCGEEVDSEVADAVALDCSYAQCDPQSCCYHTHCLEKYLKSIRLEKNRKIGFPCPRGCGKATKFKDPCRGKILKSHPVTIRSEANKKRRQAELEQLAQQTAKDKASRKAADEAKASAAKAGKNKEQAAATGAKGKTAKAPAIKALNVANTAITSAAPPKSQEQLKKEQLAAEAKKLKSQILARSSSTGSASSLAAGASKLASASSGRLSAASASGKKEVKTLDEYLAERSGASSSAALERSSSAASSTAAAPQASAWGKSRASSVSSLEAAEIRDEVAALLAAAQPAAPALAPAPSLDEAFPPPSLLAAAAAGGRPPRPPPGPAAAPPGPAPASAAVQPQGVWAQKPAASMVATTAPPPPPPRPAAHAAAPAAAGAAPAGKAKPAVVVVPVQPAAAEERLSRAQRKNLKRAEKKAAAAAAAAEREAAGAAAPDNAPTSPASNVGPGPAAPPPSAAPEPVAAAAAAAPGAAGQEPSALPASYLGESFERCMQALVQHKLAHQVEQLQQLGFAAPAALAAVQQHGCNLEAALVTLLEQATGVQDSMHGLGLPASTAPAEVDLTEELQAMQELAARYGLPRGVVELLAVEHQGDLDSLAAALAAQQHALLGFSGGATEQQQQAAAAAAAAATAATASQPRSLLPTVPEPLGQAGGGLFGTLVAGVGGEASLYADSWGASTASLDTASSSGAGCYSAFGFGFTEAALHAVHGRGASTSGSSVFGDLGGPASQEQPLAAAASIWGSGGGSLGAGGGLLSGSAAGAGFGTLGGSFDSLQPSSTQSLLEGPRPPPGFLPFPGAGGSSLQQQLRPQQPFSGLPLWGSTGGVGQSTVSTSDSLLVR